MNVAIELCNREGDCPNRSGRQRRFSQHHSALIIEAARQPLSTPTHCGWDIRPPKLQCFRTQLIRCSTFKSPYGASRSAAHCPASLRR